MKRLAFGIAILAFSFVATTPVRANFSVIKFADHHCEVWWDRSFPPRGTGWTTIAVTPDWWSAQVALDWATTIGDCH
jgi:hypothetical protein